MMGLLLLVRRGWSDAERAHAPELGAPHKPPGGRDGLAFITSEHPDDNPRTKRDNIIASTAYAAWSGAAEPGLTIGGSRR